MKKQPKHHARTWMAASAVLASAIAFSAPAFAAGNPAAGAQVFKKCAVCHAPLGPSAKNRVGPDLNGVIGRKAGTEPGYNYSPAMKKSGLTWNKATFEKYITKPHALVPGTKMAFAGLSAAADRENLFAYLNSFNADGSKKK